MLPSSSRELLRYSPATAPGAVATATHLVLGLALATCAAGQVWEVGNLSRVDPYGVQGYEHFGRALALGNFDGDGLRDLAVAAPFWNDSSSPPRENSGKVIAYVEGLRWPYTPFLGPYDGDLLGWAVITGDFDGDGRSELVMGMPGMDAGGAEGAGEVVVMELGETDTGGLDWVNGQVFGEAEPGVPGQAEDGDSFGWSFAVGWFDGDAYQDLAIGVPLETLETVSPWLLNAGSVTVLYGSASGLATGGAQIFDQDSGLGAAQAHARFGETLAAGDFDGDGYSDLAIGVPARDVYAGSLIVDAGEVVVLYGSASGLSVAGHLRLNESHVGGTIQAGDRFGAALAAGDFEYSPICFFVPCRADLAIGVPGQLDLGHPESGKVVVVRGSAAGLDPADRLLLYQDVLGDGGSAPGDFEHFGSVLAAGSLRGPFTVDLVIGVPDQDVAGNDRQGMVHVVFGGSSGLLSQPGQFLVQRQGLASAPGAASDRFGSSLAIGDLNGDQHGDLAIGIPWRAVSATAGAGMVQILYGALFADGFERGDTHAWISAP